jgi:hypothetical protein
MRRLASTILLALLAACTVTTTGAPCSSDLECPTGQGCGSDGLCGAAALSCPGHTAAGECAPGTGCSGGELVTCTAGTGVCSTGPVTTPCPAHQACTAGGASAACECAPTRCSATTSSFCTPGGQVATCAQDLSSAKGCWYAASSAACGDPGAACAESGGGASCACPVANACAQLDATTCAGSEVLRCLPAAIGSTCLTWQADTDCADSSLVCSAGACACPAHPGPVYVADAVDGSPAGASPHPTGLSSPPSCRYRSLTDALAAASAHGAGATVQAAGWSASLPGGTVLFSEPGALSVAAGVTLTTDDAVPTATHYAVTTSASLTGAFVTLGPGASLAGFEVRNSASGGAGVVTACPTSADTAPVSLSSVTISAATAGPPVVRFGSGLHLTGSCPVSMTGVNVANAVTGILSEAEAPTTMTGGALTGNGTGVSIGAGGAAAPSFSATGTSFSANAGDAVYVARGTLFTDACPFVNNGTHVHAQPVGGAAVNVTVQNSSGAAKMTGATNSAFRLLAMGSGSALTLTNNAITGNDATQSYNVSSGMRRGGGVVLTAPFPGASSFRGNGFYGNKWDQVLVAAGTGALDFSGEISCGVSSNSFACFDAANSGVGLYSNGATVVAEWNHWTVQPGVFGVDAGGIGVTGFDTRACSAATVSCQ